LKAVAVIERAILKALERQYCDILAPLKDSIQKKLGMQVQKLARRQSATLYVVPNQVSKLAHEVHPFKECTVLFLLYGLEYLFI
jgi:hypothetical protein